MHEPTAWSPRLGVITDAQFAAATQRAGAGGFIRAAPVTTGLFGQNVFITTTRGEYVLRGAPHWVRRRGEAGWRPNDRWQFTKEQYFIDRLHRQTGVPVPWPYVQVAATDIFGWPFAVMPRMPGDCLDDAAFRALPASDRRGIALAMGTTLADLQALRGPFAGDVDVDTLELAPRPGGNTAHVIADALDNARTAQAHGALDAADMAWIEATATAARRVGEPPPVCVHGDYKLNNTTLARAGPAGGDAARWRVSGVFDFHETCFGDGALDLVRQASGFVDHDPAQVAPYVAAWRQHRPDAVVVPELLALYVVNDRLKLWSWFTQPDARAPWTRGPPFRAWAGRYHDALRVATGG